MPKNSMTKAETIKVISLSSATGHNNYNGLGKLINHSISQIFAFTKDFRKGFKATYNIPT